MKYKLNYFVTENTLMMKHSLLTSIHITKKNCNSRIFLFGFCGTIFEEKNHMTIINSPVIQKSNKNIKHVILKCTDEDKILIKNYLLRHLINLIIKL